jgi:tetratricopeptide (TPR) repeat protein
MSKITKDNISELRAYLLGMPVAAKTEDIEKKFLLDHDGFGTLLDEEEELIEDYLDGELSSEERTAFENYFLLSDDRVEKLDLARLLKSHAKEQASRRKPVKGPVEEIRKWRTWRHWALLPAAAAILGIAICGYILIKDRYTESIRDRPIISLNKAYKKNRPFDARISEFEYAPFNRVRNNEPSPEDPATNANLELARLLAVGDYLKKSDAETRHSLAMVYLANRELDKALQLLKEARQAGPPNTDILNDTGVVYLQKAEEAKDGNNKLALVADAIAAFDAALALDPGFLPPRFNKAVAIEIYLPNRAKEMWGEYLQRDQDSDWAAEAKMRLESLNKEGAKNFSTAEEVEAAFAAAYREGNKERALQIVSQNREIVRDRYLPQKLAADLTEKKTKEIRSLSC